MTPPPALTLPPPLRAFLEAGCQLAELLDAERLEALAEQAVEAPRLFAPEQLAASAGMWRSILDEWLTDGMPVALLQHSEDPQLDVTALAWRIELREDPELPKLVEAALPAQLVEEALARVDADRRPFLLAAERHTTFTCCVCGEAYERTRCVRLAPRSEGYPDLSELPPVIVCPECIGAAAVAARTHSTKALPPVARLPRAATSLQRVSFVVRKLTEEGYAKRTIDTYRAELFRAENWCEDVAGYTLLNVPDAEIIRYLDTRPRSWATRKQIRSSLKHSGASAGARTPRSG